MSSIKDIMNQRVVAVRPETTLADALRVLTKHHVGGVPVVNEANALIGMISELALIDIVFDPATKGAPVSDYMTRDVKFVHPDDSLSRAAQMFALYSFRRLPVVENGSLVGIVSRRDLMNHALESSETLPEPLLELIPELADLA